MMWFGSCYFLIKDCLFYGDQRILHVSSFLSPSQFTCILKNGRVFKPFYDITKHEQNNNYKKSTEHFFFFLDFFLTIPMAHIFCLTFVLYYSLDPNCLHPCFRSLQPGTFIAFSTPRFSIQILVQVILSFLFSSILSLTYGISNKYTLE